MAITIYKDIPTPKKITVYDKIDSSAMSDTLKDTPEYLRRAGSYYNEGLAGVGDWALNLPTNIWNLGKAALGTALTAAGKPDLAPNLTQNPNLAHKAFESAGFIDPSVVPQSPGENVARGILHAGAAGMVAPARSIPQMGGNVGAAILSELAGQGTENVTGSSTAGQMARMLAVPALAGASNYVGSRASQLKSLDTKNEVFKEARQEGYKIPRSATTKATFMSNRGEGLAGKEALEQKFTIENQATTNNIAKRVVGTNEKLSFTLLAKKRAQASWPYEELRAISPRASAVLNRLQDYRNQSTEQWQSYRVSAKPKALRKAKVADSNVEMLEKQLEKLAAQAGRKDLVVKLKEARKYIAKTYDIEKALNDTTGDVNAHVIAKIYDKHKGKIDTERYSPDELAKINKQREALGYEPIEQKPSLATVARFAKAYPNFSSPGAKERGPGIGRMEYLGGGVGSGLGGMIGTTLGDPMTGFIGGAVTGLVAPHMTRSYMQTNPFQNRSINNYPLANLPPQEDALLRGLLLIGAGQE